MAHATPQTASWPKRASGRRATGCKLTSRAAARRKPAHRLAALLNRGPVRRKAARHPFRQFDRSALMAVGGSMRAFHTADLTAYSLISKDRHCPM